MMSDGSSALVSTHSNEEEDLFKTESKSWVPVSFAPPTPITWRSWLSLSLIAQRFGSVAGSTIATLAPASSRRDASAACPERLAHGRRPGALRAVGALADAGAGALVK